MLKVYTAPRIMLQAIMNDESGQDLIEYCIVAAVVVTAVAAALPTLQAALAAAFAKLTAAILAA